MKKSLGPKTLLYPAPVLIVGSYDSSGRANAAAVAWGGVCSSNPVSVCISLREARYSWDCIMEKKAFTINIPSEKYMKQADYFGIISGRHQDKIEKSGLTVSRSKLVDAPIINEFPVCLECRLKETHDLGAHTQFIGEVLDVKIDEACFSKDGVPDIKLIRPFLYSPDNMGYYAIGDLIGQGFSEGKALL